MSYRLTEDPFKYKIKTQKRPLLLPKGAINQIISHAQFLESEKEKDLQLEKWKKEREAIKEFNGTFVPRREAGSELRKAQYAKAVQCARHELEREARMEARRNFVLDMAYKRLYEDTDRVKYFQAAKDFCELLKEREEQAAAKSSQQDELFKYDTQFLLRLLRDIDSYEDEEKEKMRIREENMKKNAANWSKQYNEVVRRRNREKWENLRDGFLIQDEAKKEMQKESEKREQKQKIIQNYKKSLDEQMKEKIMLFDVRQKLDEVEDAKDKLFNDAKREMKVEHQKIKSEIDKKKAERVKTVANNMTDELSVRKAKEEASLQRAIQEAEDKALQEKAKEATKKADFQKEIEQFCKEGKARKNQKRYDDKLKDLRDKRYLDELVEKLRVIEDSKEQKKRQLEEEAQHIQLHQIEARKNENKSRQMEDIKDYLRHMRGLDQEEEMFQKYAQKEIEECEAQGIDTYAMRIASRPGIECGRGPLFENRGCIRPRYYASTGPPVDLPHLNRKFDQLDTKSRLGFQS